MSPLVDVEWLAAHLEDEHVRVVDVRWYLGAPARGPAAYASGHLPRAVFADLGSDLAGSSASGPGRHPLPSTESFVDSLSRLGIGRDTTVVAYDDAGGAIAARLWWLLGYFGLAGGRVLDGGIGAWTALGLALSIEPFHPAAAPRLELAPRAAAVVDKAGVARMLGAGAVVLDARARDRYEGRSEPIDARPGHVPGARSAPFVENLVAPAGRFLERDALSARYRALGALDAREVVCYCGSGVTACHDLLALTILGRSDALLYEGSWSDWARDAALPAATGPEPG